MRIGRSLTVQEVYNQINHFHQTIEQTVEQQVNCMLNTDSVIGKICEIMGINQVDVPILALSCSSQQVANEDLHEIVWETEVLDQLDAWDAEHPTWIDLPEDAMYEVFLQVNWAINAVGVRKAWILGTVFPEAMAEMETETTEYSNLHLSGLFSYYYPSTWQIRVWQNSGGNLNIYHADLILIRRAILPHLIQY